MRTLVMLLLLLVSVDQAAARHHYRHHRHSHHAHHSSAGLVTVSTAAGPVTVAPSFAPKIQGFIADVVARGFRGRVNCYASSRHVPGSLHYSGQACDFAQRGWGKTVAPMYHVADLAAKHGLRDGCSFRDCGHIDSGARLARSRRGGGETRIARREVVPAAAVYAEVHAVR